MQENNYMQDVVPRNGQRSIRNIPLPESRSRKRVPKPAPVYEEDFKSATEEPSVRMSDADGPKPPTRKRIDTPPPESDGRRFDWRRWKKTIIAGVVIFLVIAGFVVSTVFHSAKVTARVKSFEASIENDVFTAKKAPGASEMSFEPLVQKKEGEATVKSTGEKQVDKRASGSIVIFNNHSSAPQRLIKNTRFETPSGLIFRADSSVTVPGKTASGPGSIEALVYAESPGEKYNTALTDFSIPGFKGDPRYQTFYGRSKTPMTGGFSGVMKVVSTEDKVKADNEIMAKVTEELLKELDAKVPKGYILYPENYSISWTDLPEESLGNDEVKMKKEATLTALLLNEKVFASYLARKHVPDYEGEDVLIANAKDLTVVPAGKDDFDSSVTSVDLKVSGKALFVWQFDEAALKQDLAGKKVGELSSVLSNFNIAINGIQPSFSPFWSKSFPKNVENIKIEITLE